MITSLFSKKHEADPAVLLVCNNRANAPVEVHKFAFDKWTIIDGEREFVRVDGFNWRCLGCRERGKERGLPAVKGFHELREAKDDAQKHADGCSYVLRSAAK